MKVKNEKMQEKNKEQSTMQLEQNLSTNNDHILMSIRTI